MHLFRNVLETLIHYGYEAVIKNYSGNVALFFIMGIIIDIKTPVFINSYFHGHFVLQISAFWFWFCLR